LKKRGSDRRGRKKLKDTDWKRGPEPGTAGESRVRRSLEKGMFQTETGEKESVKQKKERQLTGECI